MHAFINFEFSIDLNPLLLRINVTVPSYLQTLECSPENCNHSTQFISGAQDNICIYAFICMF